MTLYVVSGTGTMPSKELPVQLNDLWDRAANMDDTFWFGYTPEVETTTTGKELIEFCKGNEILIAKTTNPIETMQQYSDDSPVLLALFDIVDGELQDNEELMEIIYLATSNGFKVLALNDSLEEVTITDAPEVVEPAPKKGREEPTLVEQTDDDLEPMDRIYLAGLTVIELRSLAEGMGIQYTNKEETIAAILGEEVTHSQPMLVERVIADKPTELKQEEFVLVVIHSSDGIRMTKVPASTVAHL